MIYYYMNTVGTYWWIVRFFPYSSVKSWNVIKLVEINDKILKSVYNGHLNITDTFFRSQWHSLYQGFIVKALFYTAQFNKRFKMSNTFWFPSIQLKFFSLVAWLKIGKTHFSRKFATCKNLVLTIPNQTRTVTRSPWICRL